MINRFQNYETTQAYTDSEQLPRGGYICRITGARIEETQYGQRVKIAFDIDDGPYKGYYQNKYDANQNEDKKWPGVYSLGVPKDDGTEQDNWTKRRFKTFTNALEDSNAGYHFDWDETKFKGKRIGIVFNYREYEFNGRNGMTPNPAKVVAVEAIANNHYKVPEDRLLNGSKAAPAQSSGIDGFVNIPNKSVEEEIPF